jgi:hypothetical protein
VAALALGAILLMLGLLLNIDAGSGSSTSSPTAPGLLVVRQQIRLGSATAHTEGAVSFVRVESEGELVLDTGKQVQGQDEGWCAGVFLLDPTGSSHTGDIA